MSDPTASDVTNLLRAWHSGDQDAYRRVSSILYEELRRQARNCLRRGRPDEMQSTALVHEAFLRLADAGRVDWQDRKHFMAVAARTMRRVVIDLARAQGSVKRGDKTVHVPIDSGVAVDTPAFLDFIALDRALDTLGRMDPRKAQVIELKFFGGLTVEETAAVLDVSADTIARDWRMARSWLLRALDEGGHTGVAI